MNEPYSHPFIEYLVKQKDDRAMRARLKRGLGKAPGTAPDMFRYVAPWFHEKQSQKEQSILFIVASLWASHPEHTQKGNLGDALKQICPDSTENPSIEKRFIQLLESDWEDLPYRLRQIISLLESKNQPINYSQLISDLKFWNSDTRSVQQRWAAAFWRGKATSEHQEMNSNNSTNVTKGD